MKRLTLSIILVFCAFAAQSQIFLSLNAGGSMSSGNTNVVSKISIATDSTITTDIPHAKSSSFGGGLRFGYKTGKVMFGIGANYTQSSYSVQTLDSSLIPIYPEKLWKTTGDMTTKGSTIDIVPFIRYDFLKEGDISLFVELNGFYSMEQNPTVTAHQLYTQENASTHEITTLREYDTTFTQIRSATGYGARLTPGLNWMLNSHVSLDLYLDFLSIAYSSYTRTSEVYSYSFKLNNMGTAIREMDTKTTTITEETSNWDLGLFGTPDWGTQNPGNFVRVGLNICF